MDALLGVIAILMVLFVVLGTVAAVRTVRAVRRGMERTGAQARRVVEETGLKARRYGRQGPVGELARMRLELRASIDSTRRALDAGVASDPSLREALGLLQRLHEHARELDGELKLLETEPDQPRIAGRLPDLSERTERITHSANSLRWAAQDRARQFADDELAALNREIELEAGALRHWVETDPAPSRPEVKAGEPSPWEENPRPGAS